MTPEQKSEIVLAAKAYMTEKGLTQGQLSRHSMVGESYLSSILNGKLTSLANGKEVEIKDQYFKMLGDSIGFSTEKNYWPMVETREFVQLINILERSKRDGNNATPICETGAGKTYTVDKFCMKNPDHTYKITASSLTTMVDILNELMRLLKIPIKGSQALRLMDIIITCRDIKRRGGRPMVIIDEAENLKATQLGLIKALYDGLQGYASLVLIGTPELIEKLAELERKKKQGIQQFRRRFNAGTKYITSGKDRLNVFYEFHGVGTQFRRLLNEVCTNYGELRDYLEPVLRYCDLNDKVFCEDEFRVYWDMPK